MWNFLSKLDVFPFRPQLRFMNQDYFPSKVGLLVTFLITILGVMLLIVFSRNMVNNISPTILTKNEFIADPPPIKINFGDFNIGIVLRDFENSSIIMPSEEKSKLFDIEFTLVEVTQAPGQNLKTNKMITIKFRTYLNCRKSSSLRNEKLF